MFSFSKLGTPAELDVQTSSGENVVSNSTEGIDDSSNSSDPEEFSNEVTAEVEENWRNKNLKNGNSLTRRKPDKSLKGK